ncbi:Eisosomes component [Friedmanniomyces endolithicus]|nr:Eisosomes component [Friedmanniomyces endolithicus]
MLLLAGGIVLTFFIVLSGAHIYKTPIELVYFLQASTKGITGGSSALPPNPARWTWLAVCGVVNGNNGACGPVKAAQYFDPVWNFGTSTGVPAAFLGTSKVWYLSRFAWVFYLIALFFAVVAFFLSIFALCTCLGAYLTGMMAAIALFFQTLAAALMTAWTVIGRNAFLKSGQTAALGRYAYGFTWGAMACYLIATILFCVGGSVGKKDNNYPKTSYFGRKRSTRSRGSFVDSESQRRVKDEYE